jgi:lipid II isoglutaminyl synthase (glutamine-hydrolysing)
MFRLKRLLARAVRAVSRRLGRTGGTTIPGRVLLRLDRRAIERLAGRLERGSVLVSATNGKTTTAAMIARCLEDAGEKVVHNRAGANMHWGVATALLDAGREPGQVGLFEVDEAWLPTVARALRPRVYLLANLFRDQLDRYGELELLADRWAELVSERAGEARFVLNADDPLVADLGRVVSGGDGLAPGSRDAGVVFFGIDDDAQALPELQHAADSKHCRRCGAAYGYDAVYLGHMGRYRCPGCGRERPTPHVAARRVALNGMTGSQVDITTPRGPLAFHLPLPGLYNVYNAVAAVATVLELGISLERARESLERFAAAFGRVEKLRVGDRDVSILLVKNPVGANEVLRTLTLEDGALDLWIALNDKIADGRDVSWIWDADFELLAERVRRVTCSGTRAEEMALRLKYAGVDAAVAVERDLGRSLDQAVAGGDGGPLYALPTYTALLELRDLLSRRGLAPRWSE